MKEQSEQNQVMLILSVVCPMFVLISTLFWFYPEMSPVGCGYQSLPPAVEKAQERLEETQPEVIVVGSSIANKAVDPVSLAKELELPEGGVQVLWSGRATFPTIMLMVQQRILQENLKPKVILVFATPAWMLTNKVIDQAEFDMHWTGELDPVLQESLKIGGDGTRNYIKKRGIIQDKIQDFVRYWFGEKPFKLSGNKVDRELDALFSAENHRKDKVKQQKLIQHNLHQTEKEEEGKQEWAVIPPEEERLVYQLIKQVKAKGINIVIVEMPVAKSIKDLHSIPEDISKELIEKYAELGAGHLYYFDWGEKGVLADTHHMNLRGRGLFTTMLAKDLQRIDVLQEDMATAELPKELRKPELKWSNEVGVLKNGETLDLIFQHPWRNVELEVCVSGRRKPKRSILSISGQKLETKKSWGTEVWCETLERKKIKTGTIIQVENEKSIALHLHRVRVNGMELLELPIRLIAKKEIEVSTEDRIPSAINEVKSPPSWIQQYQKQYPDLQVGRPSRYTEINDKELVIRDIPWHCSPLEAFVQGKKQSASAGLCKHILKDPEKGDNCFVSTWWISLGRENINWSKATVNLKKDRVCLDLKNPKKHYWWVYPADSLQWSFGFLRGHYSLLRLTGTSVGSGKWRVIVKNQHKVFLDTTIDELDYMTEIYLDIPVRQKMNPNVVVEITAVEGTQNYLFMRGVELDN